MKKTAVLKNCASLLPLALVSAGTASGAGLSVRTQSAQSLGTGYAAEATGRDASLIYSNPALIGSFSRHTVSLGVAQISSSVDFKNGERDMPVFNVPVTGESTSYSGVTKGESTIPSIAGVHPLTESLNLGWNVTFPYGTYTDYSNDWIGRYHALKTDLAVTNVDLALAYKINPQWTVGVGLQYQIGTGNISGASNTGFAAATEFIEAVQALSDPASTAYQDITAGDGSLNGSLKQAFIAAGPDFTDANSINAALATALRTVSEGQYDAVATYEGDGTALGAVFGVTYDPMPELRLGFSYRASMKHETSGDLTYTADSAIALAVLNSLQITPGAKNPADLDLTLPDVAQLGAMYSPMPELNLYSNITYFRWSTLDKLHIESQPLNSLTRIKWEDTMTYSLGGEYMMGSMVYRFGLAYDGSPAPDQYRSPRTPDTDRTVLSLGAGYGQDNWRIDAALAHYLFADSKLQLNASDYAEANSRGNLRGEYDNAATTFMLQAGAQI